MYNHFERVKRFKGLVSQESAPKVRVANSGLPMDVWAGRTFLSPF